MALGSDLQFLVHHSWPELELLSHPSRSNVEWPDATFCLCLSCIPHWPSKGEAFWCTHLCARVSVCCCDFASQPPPASIAGRRSAQLRTFLQIPPHLSSLVLVPSTYFPFCWPLLYTFLALPRPSDRGLLLWRKSNNTIWCPSPDSEILNTRDSSVGCVPGCLPRWLQWE